MKKLSIMLIITMLMSCIPCISFAEGDLPTNEIIADWTIHQNNIDYAVNYDGDISIKNNVSDSLYGLRLDCYDDDNLATIEAVSSHTYSDKNYLVPYSGLYGIYRATHGHAFSTALDANGYSYAGWLRHNTNYGGNTLVHIWDYASNTLRFSIDAEVNETEISLYVRRKTEDGSMYVARVGTCKINKWFHLAYYVGPATSRVDDIKVWINGTRRELTVLDSSADGSLLPDSAEGNNDRFGFAGPKEWEEASNMNMSDSTIYSGSITDANAKALYEASREEYDMTYDIKVMNNGSLVPKADLFNTVEGNVWVETVISDSYARTEENIYILNKVTGNKVPTELTVEGNTVKVAAASGFLGAGEYQFVIESADQRRSFALIEDDGSRDNAVEAVNAAIENPGEDYANIKEAIFVTYKEIFNISDAVGSDYDSAIDKNKVFEIFSEGAPYESVDDIIAALNVAIESQQPVEENPLPKNTVIADWTIHQDNVDFAVNYDGDISIKNNVSESLYGLRLDCYDDDSLATIDAVSSYTYSDKNYLVPYSGTYGIYRATHGQKFSEKLDVDGYTIAGWFKHNQNFGENTLYHIYDYSSNTIRASVAFEFVSENTIRICVDRKTTDGNMYTVKSETVSLGRWFHIAFYFGPATSSVSDIKVWVNGVSSTLEVPESSLAIKNALPEDAANNNDRPGFGGSQEWDKASNMNMSDTTVYSGSITDDNAKALYETTRDDYNMAYDIKIMKDGSLIQKADLFNTVEGNVWAEAIIGEAADATEENVYILDKSTGEKVPSTFTVDGATVKVAPTSGFLVAGEYEFVIENKGQTRSFTLTEDAEVRAEVVAAVNAAIENPGEAYANVEEVIFTTYKDFFKISDGYALVEDKSAVYASFVETAPYTSVDEITVAFNDAIGALLQPQIIAAEVAEDGTISATVKNYNNEAKPVVLVVATYNGTLFADVDFVELGTVDAGAEITPDTIDVTGGEGITVKLMLWNSVSSMTPYNPAVVR